MNQRAELLVVDGHQFAEILQPWKNRTDSLAHRSQPGTNAQNKMPTIYTAAQLIAIAMSIDESACSSYLRGKVPIVPLGIADEMLRVAGEEHAIADGRLPQYRNPRLTERTYRKRMLEAGADPDEYEPFPTNGALDAA